jgi:PAS domain S-box-containing protein
MAPALREIPMDILLAVGDNATVVPLPIKADTPPRITSEFLSGELLQALPVAVYATDAAGRITFYNEAAAALWGCRPELGESEWCGSWRLYWPDGRPMPHNECPMAVALKEKRPISGAEAVTERPDGTRIRFLAYPTPLWDKADALAGAVNTLVDITDRRDADDAARQLVAIVESSDDAIVSKDLDGTIVTWNPGAERLFGYTAEEAVGRPITILIPPDRHDEETEILNRIRRGERIDHYETVRRRKDGSLVEISLTVSPIRNADGRVTGASKIARDVTERKRAQNQQRLLIREMNHRIGNLFALAAAVTTLSARFAATPKELADAVQERLVALSRAHNLTVINFDDEAKPEAATTLLNLIRTITAPYAIRDRSTVILNGPDVPIRGKSAMSMALLLHEIATNAAKYGALSSPSGHVHVTWSVQQEELFLAWRERGGPPVNGQPKHEGFGSFLARLTATGQLGGKISYDWTQEGLTLNLSTPLDRLSK